jgi:hypothetical protein
MTIPSGSGSEVLRNAAIHNNNATTAQVDWGAATGTGSVRGTGNTSGVVAVPANVIITVLTITHMDFIGGSINAQIDWQGSGTDIAIFKNISQAANTTWVWNDKFVLREGDILKLYNSGSNSDWHVSFIYQDWT